MRKCPVCGKDNETLLCAQCGFDGSMDYEAHPTLSKVTAQAVSERKAARDGAMQDYYCCTGCGGRQFYLNKENLQPVCVSCGRVKKLAPAAAATPEVRIDTPVISQIAAIPHPDEHITFRLPVGYRGNTIAAGTWHTVAVRADGSVVATGDNDRGQCYVSGWRDVVAVAAGWSHTVGLCANGTVVAVGDNDHGQRNVSGWNDIVAVAAGTYHTLGLKANGTVVTTEGDKWWHNVSSWNKVIAVAAGGNHSVGLRADGTVVAAGKNDHGQCNVSGWKNIVAIAAGSRHTVGLSANGCVYATGDNSFGQYDVAQWEHITAIAAGSNYTIGIKHNKTVIVAGDIKKPLWNKIVAISGGFNHIVGLKSDGTVVAAGGFFYGQCDVSGWKNIRLPQNE